MVLYSDVIARPRCKRISWSGRFRALCFFGGGACFKSSVSVFTLVLKARCDSGLGLHFNIPFQLFSLLSESTDLFVEALRAHVKDM